MYNQSESCVIQNGHVSESFKLGRGCRQGDPLSPYLFLLCGEILAIMIRNNDKIRGIQIKDNIYKISQYADDTTLYLDGKESSLREVLDALNEFHLLSGLKMNIEKTKLIWFGALENSNMVLCREVNFEWGAKEFSSLGVNFAVNVEYIWNLNTDKKMLEIQRLLTRWKGRDLSIIGKITIIKSLALSKLVHLLIALPDPPQKFVTDLTKLFYNFIWKGGPDRVKREVLTQNYENGGLKMVDIELFNTALKLTWIRKFFTKPDAWMEPLNSITLEHPFIWQLGSKCNINTGNPFWDDVLKAWSNFRTKTSVVSIDDILNEPLWYNPKCKTEELYIQNWHKKGVRSIRDLVNEEGQVLKFQEFKHKYDVKGTILDYERIMRSVPRQWLTRLAGHSVSMYNPRIEKALKTLLACSKGTRLLYNVLNVRDITVPSQERWNATIEQYNINLSPEDWKEIYKEPWKCIKDTSLLSLQYKINHGFLVTNRMLLHMDKRDDDLCSFCQTERETIQHLFVECPRTKAFWNDLETWMTRQLKLTIHLSALDVLFGKRGPGYTLINMLLLVAKQYIYKTRSMGGNLRIDSVVRIFKNRFKMEKMSAKINLKNDSFVKKWAPLYDLFNVIDEY